MAEDVTASKAACSAILEVCYKAKNWKLLEEHIVLLSKRRGQLKQVRIAQQQVCSCQPQPETSPGCPRAACKRLASAPWAENPGRPRRR